MPLTNFKIVLDSSNGVYHPGSTLNGSVMFTLDRPKHIKEISIKVSGVAKTSWTESSKTRDSEGNDRSVSTVYSAKEEYFSNSFNLPLHGDLAAGNHNYPFSTILQTKLPDSFESEHGSVRYMVKATLDCSWRTNTTIEKKFTVINPVDLNYIVSAKKPVKPVYEKHFCCFWCKSGPLTLVISVPYTGYVAGQKIPITLEIDNASKVSVDHVIVKLMKFVQWKSNVNHTKQVEIEIVKFTLNGVETGKSKSLLHELTVPSVRACKLDNCGIINCRYFLRVTARVSGCHRNLSGDVPLVIGTVPIQEAQFTPHIPSAPEASSQNPPFNPQAGFQNPPPFAPQAGFQNPPFAPQAGFQNPPQFSPQEGFQNPPQFSPQAGFQNPPFAPQAGFQNPPFAPQAGFQNPQFAPQAGFQNPPPFAPQHGFQNSPSAPQGFQNPPPYVQQPAFHIPPSSALPSTHGMQSPMGSINTAPVASSPLIDLSSPK